MTPPPPQQAQAQEQKPLPKWKREKLEREEREKQQPQETRSVNPMTMIPAEASISGKAPLPPKAKQVKRLYGF